MQNVMAAGDQSYDYLKDLYSGAQTKDGVTYYDGSGGVTVGQFVSRLLPWVYGLSVLILLFCIILAGFKFMTKGKEGVADAKKMLMYGIIGFVIVMAAGILTQIVLSLFQVDGNTINVFGG